VAQCQDQKSQQQKQGKGHIKVLRSALYDMELAKKSMEG